MNIEKAILELTEQGATSFAFLEPEELILLLKECEGHNFQKAQPIINGVEQNFFEADIDPLRAPHIMRVLRRLESFIKRSFADTFDGRLSTFYFNEQRYQKYWVGPVGISGHHDNKKFNSVVAILVLQGKGVFQTHATREGKDLFRIYEEPGYCILVRATGLLPKVPIPFHSVVDITEQRIVIGARYDSSKSGL